MKRNFLKLQHWLLASLMGALGFTSCHCHKQLAVEEPVDTVIVPEPPRPPAPPHKEVKERDELKLMYGVPTMNYMIRGQVKDPKGRPVKNIRINMLERGMQTEADSIVGNQENVNRWLENTQVITDENGRFNLRDSGLPLDEVKLYIRDVDGKENGSFKNKFLTVPVTPEMVDQTNASGWNKGDLNMDLEIKMESK